MSWLKKISGKIFLRSGPAFFAVVILFIFSCKSTYTFATHAAGADLTYHCLGGLVYQVDATFYRDCGGTPEPGNITISYKSASCGYTRTALANKVPNDNGSEITMPCSTAPSTCNGGNATGIRKWVYRAVITLPVECADWVFSYHVCCRNCSITTIQTPCASNSEIYVEATLNNLIAQGNSSPQFSNMPIAFVCLGQNFNYNQGVYDIDGDSIAYELITPKTSAIAEVTFIPPLSTNSPLASSTPFTLNAVTGDMNFTPSTLQIGILAIRVKEYRAGQLIGSTIRDMQVYIQNCFNSVPAATGINGTSDYSITACVGQQLCLNIHTSDADTNQSVSVYTTNPIQGAVISQTPGNRPDVQFCWTPASNNISANPYIFTVTVYDDACPFSAVQTFSYSIYVKGITIYTTTVNPTCSGGNNGSASVNVAGSGVYTYNWNTTPFQNSATAFGLPAGNYSVTVTDTGGCSASSSVTIYDPPISVSASCFASGNITCQSGNSGLVTVSVIGGNSPFSYSWNTGASTPSLNGVGAGSYTVTITDASGCTAIASGTVPQSPGLVSASVSNASNVLCYGGSSGSINLSLSGGVAPFSFLWNTGATTQNINNLQAGNYSVTITDANGCSTNLLASISQPSSVLQLGLTSTNNVLCFGAETGSVAVAANGGTMPYNYSWNNGATGSNIGNLSSGTYVATVTDMNGCTCSITSTITEPALPLTVTVVHVVDVDCSAGSAGTIDISVIGGVAPYSYHWNNGEVTEDLSNLQPGTYSVTVTDSNGCTTIVSAQIQNHSVPVDISINTFQNVLCFNAASGYIDLNISGGQAPYNYLWSNGSTFEDINSLAAGTYTVTVTDANGCSSNSSITITQPQQPLIPQIETTQSVTCAGGSNGALQLVTTGGTPAYSYLWSNGSTTQNQNGLTTGVYTVTVTDANGCNAILSSTLLPPPNGLQVSLNFVNGNACDSSIHATLSPVISGGVFPYSYLWNTNATSPDLTPNTSGAYSLTITDSIGCTVSVTASITNILQPIQLNATIIQPDCSNSQQGTITLNVTGGTPIYTYSWNHGPHTAQVNNLNPGIYTVTVTDSSGCFKTQSFTITDSSNPVIQLSGSPVICVGDIVTLSIDSIPGQSYQWYYSGIPLNGATSNAFQTPAAGVYSVAVTGSCGTVMSNQVEITVNSIGNVSISNKQIICPGEQVHLYATGGVTYQWTPGTNITFTNIPDPIVNPTVTTTYTVSITNEFGCKTNLSVEVAVMCDSLLVPNGFSPNGDGTNDGYVIDGIENYPGNKLWVYNRWGNLVYKAKDYRNEWDGICNVSGIYLGKKVPMETYYFILDLNDGSKPRAGYLIIRR